MAQKAFGTVLKFGDGAGTEVFTTIGEVLSITPPGLSSGTIDTTHMETTGGFRTFISDTFKDGGEVSCNIQYEPSDLTTLEALVTELKNYQVVYSSTVVITKDFAAICTSFTPDAAELEGKLTGTITLKVSGAQTNS